MPSAELSMYSVVDSNAMLDGTGSCHRPGEIPGA
jgi:hypothetical protein